MSSLPLIQSLPPAAAVHDVPVWPIPPCPLDSGSFRKEDVSNRLSDPLGLSEFIPRSNYRVRCFRGCLAPCLPPLWAAQRARTTFVTALSILPPLFFSIPLNFGTSNSPFTFFVLASSLLVPGSFVEPGWSASLYHQRPVRTYTPWLA